MTAEREPGWYWVKFTTESQWKACEFAFYQDKQEIWYYGGNFTRPFAVIGPRIPTPDEVAT